MCSHVLQEFTMGFDRSHYVSWGRLSWCACRYLRQGKSAQTRKQLLEARWILFLWSRHYPKSLDASAVHEADFTTGRSYSFVRRVVADVSSIGQVHACSDD